jgi:argininosuccinate lyase
MHPAAQSFLSSLAEDAALVDTDIDVGEAHALALARAGVISRADLGRLLRAYEGARRRARILLRHPGVFHDIHPIVEKHVLAACGERAGGNAHLGKSRNDQVAADIVIFARRHVLVAAGEAAALASSLASLAASPTGGEPHPAYTHSRVAQGTTVGHWALAHAAAFLRDAERLLDARARMNYCPLGSAAVAGTSVPYDRAFAARLLGFDGVWANALDATSARDHVLELISALAILQSNLSRLASDLIFHCGEEAGVFEYPDFLADTSSAMPQKKNPDPLELARGRAGAAAGVLAGALATTHGLMSGYSRDLQELKPALWKILATAEDSANIVRLAVTGLRPRRGRAVAVLDHGFAAALDVAEWLALHKGVPFRRAHYAVGALIRMLSGRGATFRQASAAEACRVLSTAARMTVEFSEAEWRDVADPVLGASRRRTPGGPGDMKRLLAFSVKGIRKVAGAVRELALREERAARSLKTAVRSGGRR